MDGKMAVLGKLFQECQAIIPVWFQVPGSSHPDSQQNADSLLPIASLSSSADGKFVLQGILKDSLYLFLGVTGEKKLGCMLKPR